MRNPEQKCTVVKENVERKLNSSEISNESNLYHGKNVRNDVIVLDSTIVPKDSLTTNGTIVSKDSLTNSSTIVPKDSVVSLAPLSYLDTPFDWMDKNCVCDNPRRTTDEFIKDLLEKTDNKETDDCQWQLIVVNLVLCYEHWKLGALTKALSNIVECQQIITRVKDQSDFIVVNRDAVQYLVLSSLYFITKDTSQRQDIREVLTPPERHSSHVTAGIYGMRAALAMEYGYTGTKRAIVLLKRAIKMDADSAAWHFLYGKCLGRLRHVENCHDALTYVELKSLETAVELSQPKNHFYILFLAQAYREAASSLVADKNPVIQQHVNKMNDRALELYDQVLALRPDCPYINVRCAQGYMRFSSKHRNLQLAYECAKKAVEESPNNIMMNHVWGQINVKMGLYEEALPPLKLAAERGAYGAYMDWLRLRRRLDNTFNPVPELEQLLEQFLDTPYQQGTCCQLASYFYFVACDTQKAVNYLLRVMEINPMVDKMRFHMPVGFNWKRPINLYIILLVELPLARDEETKSIYPKVVELCREHFPDLLERTDLVDQLTKIRNVIAGTTKRSTQTSTKPTGDLRPSTSDMDRNWRSDTRVNTPPIRAETERKQTAANTYRTVSETESDERNMRMRQNDRDGSGGNVRNDKLWGYRSVNKEVPKEGSVDEPLSWRRPKEKTDRVEDGGGDMRPKSLDKEISPEKVKGKFMCEVVVDSITTYRTVRDTVAYGKRMSWRQNDKQVSSGNFRNDSRWGFCSVNKEVPKVGSVDGPLSWRRPRVLAQK